MLVRRDAPYLVKPWVSSPDSTELEYHVIQYTIVSFKNTSTDVKNKEESAYLYCYESFMKRTVGIRGWG